MAWLLIDNSNTRTKFALGDARSLLEWRAVIPTAELGCESLETALDGTAYDGVLVASVVPEKAALLADHFANRPFHAVSYRSPLGFGFDVANPEQIGNDRLANLVALKSKYGSPSIVIDFGTAVTFSVLSVDGNFAGGAIAPGMAAMTGYLATHTAQLPMVALSEPTTAIGTTTSDAILSGAVLGHRGMVKEILRKIISELGVQPSVIATGGGAKFAAKGIPEIDQVDPDLTLNGIRIVATRVL